MVSGAKPKSPLFAAADRLSRVAQDIKEMQFHATGITDVPVEESIALHPEEAWGRRFGTHVMLPQRSEDESPPLSAFVVPSAGMPKMPVFVESVPVKLDPQAASSHIGSALGKPGPRRFWIGRLFRGRGI